MAEKSGEVSNDMLTEMMKYDKVTVMAVGKVRSGKSTALNNLFQLQLEARPHFESVTKSVEECTIVQNGVTVRVFDTPGLGSTDVKSNDILRSISQEDIHGDSFCLLYCHSVAESSSLTETDSSIINTLTFLFGKEIWKKCTFYLTHCDSIRKDVFSRNEDEKYLEYVRGHVRNLDKALANCGVKMPPIKLIHDVQDGCVHQETAVAVPGAKSHEHGVNPSILPLFEIPSNLNWTDFAFMEILKKSGKVALTFIRLRYNLAAIAPVGAGGIGLVVGAAGGGAIGAVIGVIGALGGSAGVSAIGTNISIKALVSSLTVAIQHLRIVSK